MGYGKRFDFTKLNKNNPGPLKYNYKNDTIEETVVKNKGKSFGLSREKCKILN